MTRLVAYKLESKGSLISYFDGRHFTLIDARLPVGGINRLKEELKLCRKNLVDILQITSWDTDHCNLNDLREILTNFCPYHIYLPGYAPPPDATTANLCLQVIQEYEKSLKLNNHFVNLATTEQSNLRALPQATNLDLLNVYYENGLDYEDNNNRSTKTFFRSGYFSVACFGDVESTEIANGLIGCPILTSQLDILILPHHGADNGFISTEFLNAVNPTIAIACSNFDNQYEHPHPNIRKMLSNLNIPLCTTKLGDVFAIASDTIGNYQVFDIRSEYTNYAHYQRQSKRNFLRTGNSGY